MALDHQKRARELFLALTDAKCVPALITAAHERHVLTLEPDDQARVLAIALGISMATITRTADANPGAASIVQHARGLVAGELFSGRFGGR